MFSGLVSGTENYLDTYDNVDVDAILNSDRLLNQYMDCILEKGSCTADARSLKRKYIFFFSIFYNNNSIRAIFFLSEKENIVFK